LSLTFEIVDTQVPFIEVMNYSFDQGPCLSVVYFVRGQCTGCRPQRHHWFSDEDVFLLPVVPISVAVRLLCAFHLNLNGSCGCLALGLKFQIIVDTSNLKKRVRTNSNTGVKLQPVRANPWIIASAQTDELQGNFFIFMISHLNFVWISESSSLRHDGRSDVMMTNPFQDSINDQSMQSLGYCIFFGFISSVVQTFKLPYSRPFFSFVEIVSIHPFLIPINETSEVILNVIQWTQVSVRYFCECIQICNCVLGGHVCGGTKPLDHCIFFGKFISSLGHTFKLRYFRSVVSYFEIDTICPVLTQLNEIFVVTLTVIQCTQVSVRNLCECIHICNCFLGGHVCGGEKNVVYFWFCPNCMCQGQLTLFWSLQSLNYFPFACEFRSQFNPPSSGCIISSGMCVLFGHQVKDLFLILSNLWSLLSFSGRVCLKVVALWRMARTGNIFVFLIGPYLCLTIEYLDHGSPVDQLSLFLGVLFSGCVCLKGCNLEWSSKSNCQFCQIHSTRGVRCEVIWKTYIIFFCSREASNWCNRWFIFRTKTNNLFKLPSNFKRISSVRSFWQIHITRRIISSHLIDISSKFLIFHWAFGYVFFWCSNCTNIVYKFSIRGCLKMIGCWRAYLSVLWSGFIHNVGFPWCHKLLTRSPIKFRLSACILDHMVFQFRFTFLFPLGNIVSVWDFSFWFPIRTHNSKDWIFYYFTNIIAHNCNIPSRFIMLFIRIVGKNIQGLWLTVNCHTRFNFVRSNGNINNVCPSWELHTFLEFREVVRPRGPFFLFYFFSSVSFGWVSLTSVGVWGLWLHVFYSLSTLPPLGPPLFCFRFQIVVFHFFFLQLFHFYFQVKLLLLSSRQKYSLSFFQLVFSLGSLGFVFFRFFLISDRTLGTFCLVCSFSFVFLAQAPWDFVFLWGFQVSSSFAPCFRNLFVCQPKKFAQYFFGQIHTFMIMHKRHQFLNNYVSILVRGQPTDVCLPSDQSSIWFLLVIVYGRMCGLWANFFSKSIFLGSLYYSHFDSYFASFHFWSLASPVRVMYSIFFFVILFRNVWIPICFTNQGSYSHPLSFCALRFFDCANKFDSMARRVLVVDWSLSWFFLTHCRSKFRLFYLGRSQCLNFSLNICPNYFSWFPSGVTVFPFCSVFGFVIVLLNSLFWWRYNSPPFCAPFFFPRSCFVLVAVLGSLGRLEPLWCISVIRRRFSSLLWGVFWLCLFFSVGHYFFCCLNFFICLLALILLFFFLCPGFFFLPRNFSFAFFHLRFFFNVIGRFALSQDHFYYSFNCLLSFSDECNICVKFILDMRTDSASHTSTNQGHNLSDRESLSSPAQSEPILSLGAPPDVSTVSSILDTIHYPGKVTFGAPQLNSTRASTFGSAPSVSNVRRPSETQTQHSRSSSSLSGSGIRIEVLLFLIHIDLDFVGHGHPTSQHSSPITPLSQVQSDRCRGLSPGFYTVWFIFSWVLSAAPITLNLR